MATFLPWTWSDEKLFELALVKFSRESPYYLENISLFMQKPIEEVMYYYNAVLDNIMLIEPPGTVALTNHPKDEYLSFKEADILNRKEPSRKRGIPWTTEEHELFLVGLKKYGKGDWKSISRECVKTRTSTQVASHAQKYFLRQNLDSKARKRSSIHDITLNDDGVDVTNVPDGSNLESTEQQQQFVDQFLSDDHSNPDGSNLESTKQQQQFVDQFLSDDHSNPDGSNLESTKQQQQFVDQFLSDDYLNPDGSNLESTEQQQQFVDQFISDDYLNDEANASSLL